MRFTVNGQQVRRSTDTDDEKLAKRIYDKVKGQVAEGKWFDRLPGEEKTFKEMMDRYKAEYLPLKSHPKNMKALFINIPFTKYVGKQIYTGPNAGSRWPWTIPGLSTTYAPFPFWLC
jgi:hypothetical protein